MQKPSPQPLRTPRSALQRYDAIIIGAGFSGLYQLHRLRDDLGLSVRLLEAGDGVGGTWYWNRYPGARCDSESYYYSYSFSSDLEQEWNWTERYPEHSEIRRYLEHVAQRFDLLRDIQFGTRASGASFDEDANHWLVSSETGERFTAQFLITAVGCLTSANVPDLPGLNTFGGRWYHTSRWPHEGVDFAGKRVGVLGTGSTGIQTAPVIAQTASHLTVFQRTPNYSIPARNRPLSEDDRRWIKQNYRHIREKARASTNGHPFDVSDQSAFEVSAEERLKRYESAWEAGGLRFRASFKDLLFDKAANDTASDFIRAKIRETVENPEVAKKLLPLDHPFATKRPPIDTDYFEMFNRRNVELVDIKESPIERITPEGIRTKHRDFPLDVIVFATGFDAMTGALLAIDLRGVEGRPLSELWAAGPRTYLGLQIAGLPNLFTITGPGSPSVLTNMPTSIEQHVDWITNCIRYLREHDLDRIEPEEISVDDWAEHVESAASATLMQSAATSWYLGANIPGKPRVFLPYAGGLAHYAAICNEVARNGYRGFILRSSERKARQSG